MLKLGEKVLLDPMPVEGHVTVQLFDALTGKQVEEQRGKNFLSRALTERIMRYAQRYVFGHQHPAQWEMTPWSPIMGEGADTSGFFRWMILTDSALAEAPTTEHTVPGAIIGYSNRQTHSDVDRRRGSINRAESHHTLAQTRWVMDWATDRGNGTIQSVCWALHNVFAHSQSAAFPGALGIGLTPPTLDWRSGINVPDCGFYEGDYWVSAGTTSLVRRLSAATGGVVWERTLPAPVIGTSGTIHHLAVRGDWIFYVGNDSTLRRHTISTNTTSASLGSVAGVACRLALIGDILYISPNDVSFTAGSSLTLRRYNVIAPGWLSDLVIPNLPSGVHALNFFLAGGNLLRVGVAWGALGGQHGVVAQYHDIDVLAGTITPLPFLSPSVHYIVGAGGGLKVWVPTQTMTYLSGTMRPADGLLWSVSDMRAQTLLSRIRLAAPIVKDSTRTMKVIYDFNYL